MQHEIIQLAGVTLAGIMVRTNNKNEMDPTKAKIGSIMGKYWSQQVADNIQNRLSPGKTYAVYCEFEEQDQGEYTYFIGEEVSADVAQQNSELQTIMIAPSRYQKMTTAEGQLPEIVIKAWQNIWQMPADEFKGRRTFQADFEIYDQRCANPEKAIIDIYIGLDG